MWRPRRPVPLRPPLPRTSAISPGAECTPAPPATSSQRSPPTAEPGQLGRRKARGGECVAPISGVLASCWSRGRKVNEAGQRIQKHASVSSCSTRKAPVRLAALHVQNWGPSIETYPVQEIGPAGRGADSQQQDGQRQHFRLKLQPRRAPLRDRLKHERGCLLMALCSDRLKSKARGGAPGTEGEAREGGKNGIVGPCQLVCRVRGRVGCVEYDSSNTRTAYTRTCAHTHGGRRQRCQPAPT